MIERIIVLRFRTFEFFRTSVCSPRYHLIYLLMKITLFGSVKPIHLTRDHGAPTDPPNGVRIGAGEGFSRGIGALAHTVPPYSLFPISALLVSVNAFEMIVGSLTLFPSNTFNTKHNSECVLCSCFTALKLFRGNIFIPTPPSRAVLMLCRKLFC